MKKSFRKPFQDKRIRRFIVKKFSTMDLMELRKRMLKVSGMPPVTTTAAVS